MRSKDDEKSVEGMQSLTGADGETVHLLSYEIVDEEVDDPDNLPIPAELMEEHRSIFDRLHTDPAAVVPRLVELVEKYPRHAVWKNWLHSAYIILNRITDADHLVDLLYREHPDYLFARIAKAQQLMARGQLQAVTEVLPKLDLKLLYPHRTRFHISEAVAMMAFAGGYLIRTGEADLAERHLAQMQQFAPDHPATTSLQNQILMDRLMTGFRTKMPGAGRKPKSKLTSKLKSKLKAKRGPGDKRRPKQ